MNHVEAFLHFWEHVYCTEYRRHGAMSRLERQRIAHLKGIALGLRTSKGVKLELSEPVVISVLNRYAAGKYHIQKTETVFTTK